MINLRILLNWIRTSVKKKPSVLSCDSAFVFGFAEYDLHTSISLKRQLHTARIKLDNICKIEKERKGEQDYAFSEIQ